MEIQEEWRDEIIKDVERARLSNGQIVVLSFDPMHQIHNNETGYEWQEKGKEGTKCILSNTGRRRLNILGALNLSNLDIVPFLTEANCNNELIQVFLEEVRKHYPHQKEIIIYLDNASYQRNYRVQAKAESLGITLKYMPPYAPNLCLIERLWKFLKKKVVRNKYYSTFQEFYDAILTFFQNWDLYLPELRSLLSLKFEIIN